MRKPRFSMRQHIETGQILKDILRCLSRMSDEVKTSFPLKNKANPALTRAVKALEKVRQHLNNECSDDFFPDVDDFDSLGRVYYSDMKGDLTDEEMRLLASHNDENAN